MNIFESAVQTQLLQRDEIEPLQNLINESIKEKNICITGAGGSIGSELSIQSFIGCASKIILIDNSEFSLYQVYNKLKDLKEARNLQSEVIPILGCVTHTQRLKNILSSHNIHTLYHTAAYKHLPLVESNVVAAAYNNIIGTNCILEAADQAGIERFIYISSDKAVRPTNIMGATKRISENLVGVKNKNSITDTIYTVVRFGNVLDSSGSVIPLFREQIKHRQPITVTHPEVKRYFMTISEAASLVIQSGSMANGGEVFLLDMGEQILIRDLAELMVKLNGMSVKSISNPNGEIEIKYIGLRPGEKLEEELLINEYKQNTQHSKIFKSNDEFTFDYSVNTVLADLQNAINKDDADECYKIIINAANA